MHDLEAAQAAFDTRRMQLIASALKNFKQDEVANKDRLGSHRSFEFRGRRRQRPPKVRDPDGAINQDHDGRDGRSWRISSRSPSQPKPLSDFNARACLRSLNHQPQPLFHHRPLGRQAGELQGLSHQFVVDFDIGAHVWRLGGMCTPYVLIHMQGPLAKGFVVATPGSSPGETIQG